MLKLALIQMTATNVLEHNLAKMRQFIATAHQKAAEIIVFPEMAYFRGSPQECTSVLRQYPKLMETFSSWAKEVGADLLPGTLREPVDDKAERYYNTLPYFDPSGALKAKYRKLHLFKANLPDRSYDESALCQAGNNVVYLDRPWGKAGLSICFDLRFPEMFRCLKQHSAQVVFLPSAFTIPTGKAHWEPLLRARAIENQCFVVAPALTGQCGDGWDTYGHSMVISPWGDALVSMEKEEGLEIVSLDLEAIAKAEQKINARKSRRNDLFG